MIAPGPYIDHLFGDEVVQQLRRNGNWVIASVHHSIDWPTRDMMFRYDEREFFLRGVRDGDCLIGACICVRRQHEEFEVALAAIYRFASILGWYKRGFVEVTGQIGSNSSIRYEGPQRPYRVVPTAPDNTFSANYLPILPDELSRRALAFWREGRWLEHQHAPYAFLSFYKVIESQFQDGRARGRWIDTALPTLVGDSLTRLNELSAQGITDHGEHIFESGRCAVAHAGAGGVVADPDRPEDRVRLARDLVIVRDLAERYIRDVLGVPDQIDVANARDRLAPIHDLLDTDELARLKAGGTLPRRRSTMNGLTLSLAVWPHRPVDELLELTLRVDGIREGRAYISAQNSSGTISFPLILDFIAGRAHVTNGRYLDRAEGGNLEDSVAVIAARKAIFMNRLIELRFNDDRVIDCEVVVPVNVDVMATLRAWEQEEDALRQEYVTEERQ